MSEKQLSHLPAKLVLVGGIAAVAMHPESLAHEPGNALIAPQPAASVPHETPLQPHALPHQHPAGHESHPQPPTVTPTALPAKIGKSIHITKQIPEQPAKKEHWTSRQPIESPSVVTIKKTPHGPDTGKGPEQLVNLHPENLTIPQDVADTLSKDTVRITPSGCSGALIRNGAGDAIGALTAEHCGFRGQMLQRYNGSDGQRYVVSAPVQAETGDYDSALTPAAQLNQLYLPEANDTSLDFVYAAAEGHTLDEVRTAYKQSSLSEAQIDALKTGDTMYLSGWPVYQPNNPGKALERQSFALSILGTAETTTTTPETLKVLWAAVPASEDGAECSFGDSGGRGSVEIGGKLYSAGTLAAFMDLTGKVYGDASSAAAWKQQMEQMFGVSLDGFAAICGFAYETPSEANGGETVQVVPDSDHIPGYDDTYGDQAIFNRLRASFFDPNTPRIVADAVAEIGLPGPDVSFEGGNKGGPAGYTYMYVDRPSLLHDSVSNKDFIAFYSGKAADGLSIMGVDPGFANTEFYDRDDTAGAVMLTSSGAVTGNPLDGIGSAGDFVDANGLPFGQVLDSTSPLIHYDSPYFVGRTQDGQFELYEVSAGK